MAERGLGDGVPSRRSEELREERAGFRLEVQRSREAAQRGAARIDPDQLVGQVVEAAQHEPGGERRLSRSRLPGEEEGTPAAGKRGGVQPDAARAVLDEVVLQ